MGPILIGAGLVALIAKAFSDDSAPSKKRTTKNKIFISFAIEDKISRDHLVKQAKLERSPFSFVDMSVKEPWNNDEWKRIFRTHSCFKRP